MDYRRLKPYHGLLLMGVALVALVFVAAPLQLEFGITGLALTELMLLALTAAAFLITRPGFRETFPLRLPPIREFFGGAFLYVGTYVVMIPPLLLTQYFFPEIGYTAESLSQMGTSVSPAMAVLIVAVMPAICEEAMHRGFILSSLKTLKSTSAIVLLNGLLFGIFHLDPYRFLPTMMLGCVFAYIAIKTQSMFLTMLFHFINNLFSVVSMFAMQPEAESYTELYSSLSLATVIGAGLIYLGFGAVMLFIGYCIINRRAPKQITIAVVVISAIVCAAAGAITVASTSISKIMDMSGTFEVSPETGSLEIPLTIESEGIYSVSVYAICPNTGINFTLERAGAPEREPGETAEVDAAATGTSDAATDTPVGSGTEQNGTTGDLTEIVLSQSGEHTLIMAQNLVLESGEYTLRIALEPEREGVYPKITLQIQILRLLG